MPQVGPMKGLDLADITGYLLPWRPENAQPQLLRIEGKVFVSIYPDEAALDAGMRSLDVTGYTVKRIDDGVDFAARLTEGGVRICINARRVREPNVLHYTELRMGPDVVQGNALPRPQWMRVPDVAQGVPANPSIPSGGKEGAKDT